MRTLFGLLLAFLLAVSASAAGKKLVLKDGSYQMVRSYERNGDRVRYFSLERNEWEEVPAALVDWKATDETNKQDQAEGLEKAKEAGEAERAAVAANFGPEIAPGVHLPDEDGIFVLLNGKPQALPRQEAKARVDKGRVLANVILPAPVLKNRTLVEIPGAAAAIRLDASPPALYANGRARDDSRYVLVRLKPKGDKRQVEAILTNIIGRNPKHSGDYIELDSQTLAPNIYRLAPRRPLAPGDYAVLEFLGNDLNMHMWDFGVGPPVAAKK